MYALPKHKQNPNLKANREKVAKFTKLSFCQRILFLNETASCKMFNMSILRKQSIRLFQQKLWYEMISPYALYIHKNPIRITKGNNSIRIGPIALIFFIINVHLVDINVFAKFDEIPPVLVQDMNENPNRRRWPD